MQRNEHTKDAIKAAPTDVSNRERLIAESIRLVRSAHAKRANPPSPLFEHAKNSASPQKTPSSLSSDWNVLTDTVEEPTDVNFELPIAREFHHRETFKSENSTEHDMGSSLENLAPPQRVNLILFYLTCFRNQYAKINKAYFFLSINFNYIFIKYKFNN